jgi:predicted secreted hydrolase
MVFLVRDGDTPSLVGGSVSDAECHVTEVSPENVSTVATGEWTSEVSGITWPSGWTVTVNGEAYTLTPSMQDQELYVSENTYWEGEVIVSGAATGRGYVELTGYN